MDWLS
jgi:hypothetical protein